MLVLRFLRRGVIPVAALALAAPAVAVSPAQASTPGWRITQVFGAPGYPDLQSVTASGPANAWIGGTSVQALLAEHWDGSQWQAVPPPASFDGSVPNDFVNVNAVGSSSAANTWFFPTLSTGAASIAYALRWTGSAWTAFRLSKQNSVLGTAVFGRSNVWLFGQKPGSGNNLGFGPAWVLRFNGTAWRSVSVPATPVGVSAVSASDMWAIGPSAKTVNAASQVIVTMHWNGTAWRVHKLPAIPPAGGNSWIPVGIAATGPDNAWVEELHPGNPGTGQTPVGTALLHWNGRAWSRAGESGKLHASSGMTPDGHGGLWLAGSGSGTQEYFAHFSGGRFTLQAAPTETGFTVGAGGLEHIPGTRSVWALGSLTPTGNGLDESAILKYGP
jgi:hypothetical protein